MPRGVYERTDKHRAIAKRRRSGTRGGRTLTGNGYVRLRMPDHPMADSTGYVMEHRLRMAEHLGRVLSSNEHVHHKNSDRQDNRIDNLELLGADAHCAEHGTGRRYPDRKGRQWTAEQRAKVSASVKALRARQRGE